MKHKLASILTPNVVVLVFVLVLGLSSPASAVDTKNFGVLDVGGIARFIIASPDNANINAFLNSAEQGLALSLTSLRAVGYDDLNFQSAAPLIAIKTDGPIPIVQFNGKNLLYATPESAQFHGLTTIELARYWATNLQKVSEKLPFISAENIRIYAPETIEFLLKDQPQLSGVYVGGTPICMLRALPSRLLPSQHRSDIVHARILNEVNLALKDSKYPFSAIRASSLKGQAIVVADNRIIMTVTDIDALHNQSNPFDLAKLWAKNLKSGLETLTRT